MPTAAPTCGTEWGQVGHDIDGEAAYDTLGMRNAVGMSADGLTMAVGSNENDSAGHNAGHVRVFKWAEPEWKQIGQDITGKNSYDYAGSSVELSADGRTLAVGAHADGTTKGHVSVYTFEEEKDCSEVIPDSAIHWAENRATQSWGPFILKFIGSQAECIKACEDNADCAGWSYRYGDPTHTNYRKCFLLDGSHTKYAPSQAKGHFHSGVCKVVDTKWVQKGADIIGEEAYDYSGAAIDISADGNIVAVGAYKNDGEMHQSYYYMADGGHVRVYMWHAATRSWKQMGKDVDGEEMFGESGISIDLSADGFRLAVGAHENSESGQFHAGHVRVYEYDSNDWAQMGNDIDGEAEYDYSGSAISMSDDGEVLAVGAFKNDGAGSDAGHVRVYSWTGANWRQMGADLDGKASYDNFGVSVDLSADGHTMAVGAWGNDDGGQWAGQARIYTWDEANVEWTQKGDALNGEARWDHSGSSVDLSADGHTLAVGAFRNDGNGDNSGHVRVYSTCAHLKVTGTPTFAPTPAPTQPTVAPTAAPTTPTSAPTCGSDWQQMGLDIDGEARYDTLGMRNAVDLSSTGLILAVGSNANDKGGKNAGHVRVFEWSSTGMRWLQMGTDIIGQYRYDYTGSAVELSADGHTLAVGAHQEGADFGSVRVYTFAENAWTQKGKTIIGEEAYDYSGAAIDMSANGDIVAVGAYRNNGGTAGEEAGSVRVFRWEAPGGKAKDGNTDDWEWVPMGGDIDGEEIFSQAGIDVQLSADGLTLAVGAKENSGGSYHAGHVRVFHWDGSAWQQKGEDIDGESEYDYSGSAIDMSDDGNIIAVGAYKNDGYGSVDAGHVRIYQWSGSKWEQMGSDLDGQSAYDNFGVSVDLSADGHSLAVGAWKGDMTGRNAGESSVYKWDGSDWTQHGQTLGGEKAFDQSGSSVDLSADGHIIAVGARMNDGGGRNSGHVRVYSTCAHYTN
jgi:hypothetical protein